MVSATCRRIQQSHLDTFRDAGAVPIRRLRDAECRSCVRVSLDERRFRGKRREGGNAAGSRPRHAGQRRPSHAQREIDVRLRLFQRQSGLGGRVCTRHPRSRCFGNWRQRDAFYALQNREGSRRSVTGSGRSRDIQRNLQPDSGPKSVSTNSVLALPALSIESHKLCSWMKRVVHRMIV